MAVEAESRYPSQLSTKVQSDIEELIKTSLAEVPEPYRTEIAGRMQSRAEALTKTILAEVSDIYKEGLTRQVALLTKENEELKERLET